MQFKAEAFQLYQEHPDLFATFECTPSFLSSIKMLKPGKEFLYTGKKYDIISTIGDGTNKQWVCIQDEYEMALEELIEEHKDRGHDKNPVSESADWLKNFRSTIETPWSAEHLQFSLQRSNSIFYLLTVSEKHLDLPLQPPKDRKYQPTESVDSMRPISMG
jgi:hypothetical protein